MKQRDARYEFIRTVAMVLVIGVHVRANVHAVTAMDEIWRDILLTVFFLCNGLFFMLSGRFALACQCDSWEDYQNYYLKKLVGLGVPVLVYMLLRTVYDNGWTFPLRTTLRQFTLNVLGYYEGIDFWFLYHLFGMLMIAPVLGKFFQKAGRKEILLILFFALGYNTIKLYGDLADLPFDWRFPLSGDLLYFMLGYSIEKLVTDKKQERIVYILGAASFVLTLIQKALNFEPGVHSTAPTYVCMLTAAFLGLKRLYRPGKTADRVFTWIGKYSMAVYMVHVIVLNDLKHRISLNSYLGQIALLMLLTTVISLAVGFVMDNLIIHPIQKGLYRLLSRKKHSNEP